eukprot:NODE_233_length_13658_cov_0.453647.p10 type:complete len:180 gc:universal NODE_233_length_13658_cov_0.453647:13254-12715(-)
MGSISYCMSHMKLVSGNLNKVREWNEILPVHHVNLDLLEIQGTIDEIVKHKVKSAYAILGEPCIVEDVALTFNGMNGLPGPYIKSFLTMGLDQLVKLRMMGDGSAKAICVVGYHDGTDVHIFKGMCDGKITPSRGEGFGWDPIFEYNGKTFAEMNSHEKNAISHRKKAIMLLKSFIESQ